MQVVQDQKPPCKRHLTRKQSCIKAAVYGLASFLYGTLIVYLFTGQIIESLYSMLVVEFGEYLFYYWWERYWEQDDDERKLCGCLYPQQSNNDFPDVKTSTQI